MRGFKRISVFKEKKGQLTPNPVLRKFRGKAGVYLIYSHSKIAYIGHSRTQLKKTITRHFQAWNDDQYRVTFAKRKQYSVKIFTTKTSDAPILEEMLILKHRPKLNKRKLETASHAQKERATKRFKKSVPTSFNEEEQDCHSYNEKGELLDCSGNVIF